MRQVRRVWATAAVGASLALGLAVLPGCGCQAPAGEAASEAEPQAGESEPQVPAVQEPADGEPDKSDLILDDGDDNMVDLTIDEAVGEVEVGSFTFVIPQYWAGRVSCDVTSHPSGACQAVVHLPENPDAVLAWLELVAGDEPMAVGDIGSHLVGSVADGNGSHVEVWTLNWPWLAANSSAEDVTSDQLALLVDLSTGGQLTLDDVQTLAEGDLSMTEASFASSTLVPTVAFG